MSAPLAADVWHRRMFAIALAALIFNVLYWSFGFLRMATGGLAVQAYGASDGPELVAVLGRVFLIAGVAGIGLFALSPAIDVIAFRLV